jgi:glycolate oxidase FAD binding subunit
MGTLGVILDVSLKVMPQAAASATLRLESNEAQATVLVNEWAAKALPVDASAWWDGTLVTRLRGANAAVLTAAKQLTVDFGAEVIASDAADLFWQGLRDQQDEYFKRAQAAVESGGAYGVSLWRISVPATAPPLGLGGEQLIEWGGALRWLCTGVTPIQVRERAMALGGHAQIYLGPDALRLAGWSIAALPPVLSRIHQNLKQAFDPAGIFNRGRWFADAADV